MNARDLPGPGDRPTWGHRAARPGSPDFEEAPEGESPMANQLADLRHWLDSFERAAKRNDRRRMETAKTFAKSLMDGLIEDCPR